MIVLCNLLEREQDPYTLMKLASASKIKDKNLEKIILDLLLKIEQRPLSYRTKMHLLEALGIQVQFLRKFLEISYIIFFREMLIILIY